MREWDLPSDPQSIIRLPWWWTFIRNLLKRFDNIQTMSALSPDGTPPPREYWLDDEMLDEWKKEQEALRSQGVSEDGVGQDGWGKYKPKDLFRELNEQRT